MHLFQRIAEFRRSGSQLSLRLLADYSRTDERCCQAVIIRETELAGFSAFHGLASDGVDQSGLGALSNLSVNGGPNLNGSEQWGVSGELRWDIGAAKLTSITAYRDFQSSQTTVGGFTGNDTFTVGNGAPTSRQGILPSGDRIRTFSQELRLQGAAFDGALDWLIGGFYSKEKIRADQTLTLNADFQRTGSAFNFGNLAGVNPLFALTALGNGGAWDRKGSAPGSSVIKGGSWLCADNYCVRYRPAARQPADPQMPTNHIGFRTVRRQQGS